jgi:AbrB family looped-hinge helix DNA binding protein
MYTSKVGRRGQITLPSALRKKVGLHEGDSIIFLLQDGQVILHPIHQTLSDLRGSILVEGEQDFNAIRRQVIAHQTQKKEHHDR